VYGPVLTIFMLHGPGHETMNRSSLYPVALTSSFGSLPQNGQGANNGVDSIATPAGVVWLSIGLLSGWQRVTRSVILWRPCVVRGQPDAHYDIAVLDTPLPASQAVGHPTRHPAPPRSVAIRQPLSQYEFVPDRELAIILPPNLEQLIAAPDGIEKLRPRF